MKRIQLRIDTLNGSALIFKWEGSTDDLDDDEVMSRYSAAVFPRGTKIPTVAALGEEGDLPDNKMVTAMTVKEVLFKVGEAFEWFHENGHNA